MNTVPASIAAVDDSLAALARAAAHDDWETAGTLVDGLLQALAAAQNGSLERSLLQALYRRAQVAVDELRHAAQAARGSTRDAVRDVARGRRAVAAYA